MERSDMIEDHGAARPQTWTVDRATEWLQRSFGGEQIIVLANREPFRHDRDACGRIVVTRSGTGVVHAVEPLLAACSGVWVAHGAGSADRDVVNERDGMNVPPDDPRYRLRRVWMEEDEERGYYDGFANEALWPLCHRVHVRPVFRRTDFDMYWAMNSRFAEAVCEEALGDAPVVLVQDYHFALAPLMIRERLPRSTIVSFWHGPWPHWQMFEICPWHDRLVEGLAASDIVGLQTRADVTNFLETAQHSIGAHVDHERRSMIWAGRHVPVCAYPVSVPWPNVWGREPISVESCRRQVQRQLGLRPHVRIGVGVDRLDYTKGIEEKLMAVERLLESRPDLRGAFTFIQLAAPSRARLPAYKHVRSRVLETTARINGRFGDTRYQPVILLEADHEQATVYRFLRAADVCYVASLHDGMNLVAKEFVSARDDEHGVLMLSSFTGAAQELTDARLVNPYDIEDAANAFGEALCMSRVEQRDRMRRMRQTVSEFKCIPVGRAHADRCPSGPPRARRHRGAGVCAWNPDVTQGVNGRENPSNSQYS
jgi:trehalose 6-phosphate synthase